MSEQNNHLLHAHPAPGLAPNQPEALPYLRHLFISSQRHPGARRLKTIQPRLQILILPSAGAFISMHIRRVTRLQTQEKTGL